MTAAETQVLLDSIIAEINNAADFIGTLDPELIPIVLIGKAIDKQIPGLAATIQNWVEGNPPTDAEKADVLSKLAVLGDPNNP